MSHKSKLLKRGSKGDSRVDYYRGFRGDTRSLDYSSDDERVYGTVRTAVGTTYTPKVCRIMAFWAIFRGFGPLFYLLLGSRYRFPLVFHTVFAMLCVS